METIEGNKLIAEFMEYPTKELKGRVTDGLAKKLYSDWNSLMSVVEKIEGLGYKTYIVFFDGMTKMHQTSIDKDNTCLIKQVNKSKIQSVWLACIEFIKWYNTCNRNPFKQ